MSHGAVLDRLDNGALLIDKRCVDTSADVWVVLAVRPELNPSGIEERYATWVMQGNGTCFWGHYFNDILEAATDYKERR